MLVSCSSTGISRSYMIYGQQKATTADRDEQWLTLREESIVSPIKAKRSSHKWKLHFHVNALKSRRKETKTTQNSSSSCTCYSSAFSNEFLC